MQLKHHFEAIDCSSETVLEKKQRKASKGEEDMFDEIDMITNQISSLITDEKPLIVIDASNVAMRHGKNSFFSVKGIQVVVEYWQKNGHKVVCFLPDYLFSHDQVNLKKKLSQLNIKEFKAS